MTSAEDPALIDAMRLNFVAGVGPALWRNLIAAFGSPTAVLSATVDQLRQVSGVGPKLSAAISQALPAAAARLELSRCLQLNIQVLYRGLPSYPYKLEEIPDPPALLYCRGAIQQADELAVAIVGSRQSTPYGQHQADRIAGGLARAGITVISGLARGIDAAAHRGALAAGGRTIAVCATGLGMVYPPEHATLAEDVSRQGSLVSESPLDQAPLPGLFPQRNRIISGLSVGVIIIEAHRASGALHTARHAMEQNRDLFVVPGRIDSEASAGCLDLIRDGATLIRGVDDVLTALGPLQRPVTLPGTGPVHVPAELKLNELESTVLQQISAEATDIDQILRSVSLAPAQVLSTLTLLEMRRLIRRLPGNAVVRAH